jgi:protease I
LDEENVMAKPKVLILTGDAAESLEVMYPYQRLLEEGYDVQIAAPAKKKLRFVVHDFEPGFDTYTEKPGYSWDANLAFKDVNPADYAALVIPGGRAPEHIRNHEDFRKIVRHFFEQKKPVVSFATPHSRSSPQESSRTGEQPRIQLSSQMFKPRALSL